MTPLRVVTVVMVVMVVMMVALAQAVSAPRAAGQAPSRSEVEFESVSLENGLRVLVSEDHAAPTFSVCVAYAVGSGDETTATAGYAHLVEHLMFHGSANVGAGEHYAIVEEAGGGLTANTNADRTLYCESFPSNQLDLGLFLEADRMRSLEITAEALDDARAAVAGERELRYEGAPYGMSYETLLETAYDSFGYGHSTIPAPGALDRATPESVREFVDTHYTPGNAVLALVGDLDTGVTADRVRSHFGSIPSGRASTRSIPVDLPQREERRATVQDENARFPRLDIGYRVTPGNTPQWYMLAVLGDVLAGGQTSRLYRRLVEREGLALDLAGGVDERRGSSLFQVSVVAAPDADLQALEAIILEEIESLTSEPVSPAELERVRARLERAEAEDRYSTLARAATLATNTVFYDDPGLINRTPGILSGITPEAIRSAAGIYLRETARSVVTTVPVGERTILGGQRP
jgi:predicted Zn-dependent peptidase